MKQSIPSASPKTFSFAENMADGLKTHETSLSLMYNTESVLRGEIATARITATKAQTAADKDGKQFIVKTRDVLKPFLGTSWSQAWEQAGFQNGSLAVPPAIPTRMELLKRLQIHLTDNPTQENAPLQITKALAESLHGALSDAVSAVNAAKGELKTKKQAQS